jgi:branched-chain amino acid transport system permease protein
LKSFDILIFVVLGGLGSMSGSVISAILLTIVSTFLQDYPETRMILYSLVLILVMIYRPTGLLGNKELTSIIRFGRGAEGGKQDANKQTVA